MSLSITWLGHATFLLQSPGGKRVVLDPWVTGNPTSPEAAKKLGVSRQTVEEWLQLGRLRGLRASGARLPGQLVG